MYAGHLPPVVPQTSVTSSAGIFFLFFSYFSITKAMYLQANEVIYYLLQENFFFVHKCNKGTMKE